MLVVLCQSLLDRAYPSMCLFRKLFYIIEIISVPSVLFSFSEMSISIYWTFVFFYIQYLVCNLFYVFVPSHFILGKVVKPTIIYFYFTVPFILSVLFLYSISVVLISHVFLLPFNFSLRFYIVLWNLFLTIVFVLGNFFETIGTIYLYSFPISIGNFSLVYVFHQLCFSLSHSTLISSSIAESIHRASVWLLVIFESLKLY